MTEHTLLINLWKVTSKRGRKLNKYKVKISELMRSKLKHNPEEVIHNFSSYNLSTTEKSLLCKGLNFALLPKDLKFENYLLPFELLFRNVYESSDKDKSLLHLKSKIKDVGFSSYRVSNEKDHRYENLSPEEYDAFVNLNNNKGLIIQKADKGNTVVSLDHSSYITQIEELLSDKSKFVKVNFNLKHKVNKELQHLLDMESTTKSCLHDLLNNNYLSQEDHKFLKPCGSKPRIMYGLCKVHRFNPVTKDVPPF